MALTGLIIGTIGKILFMKQLLFVLVVSSLAFLSCNNDRYIDLNTGKGVNLEKDPQTGLFVDVETKKPVEIYVDTKTNDTIWGRSGKVINGRIVRVSEGTYRYDNDVKVEVNDGAYEIKDGDYKKEVEKDGDVKIKDGDTKIKIDGETGKKKVKKDD